MEERIERVSDRPAQIRCSVCGRKAPWAISLPVIRGFTPHYDEFAGEYFTSHEDRRRKLEAKGLAEAGDTGIRDKRGRIYSVPGVGRRGGNSVPYIN